MIQRLSPLERIGLGIERMFTPASSAGVRGSRPWVPGLRLIRRRREVVIQLNSPEINPRKIRIQLSGRVLTFSAATLTARSDYHAFKRSVVLPEDVDWRHPVARVAGQSLTVRFRKLEKATP